LTQERHFPGQILNGNGSVRKSDAGGRSL
jgi:hypothetical protein